MNYYWLNDRRSFITNESNSTEFNLIPIDIKIDLVVNYLYGDIFMYNSFFCHLKKDKRLMYTMTLGLMPRQFIADDNEDKIIIDDDADVSELYLMTQCKVGIAINAQRHIMSKNPYSIGKLLYG